MAHVFPFRGLRYDCGTDLAQVVAPPYDIIDAAQQQELYARSPYNIIRLELGMEHPDDAPGHDRYSRAAATLAQWQDEGVLVVESRPALYYYEEEFELEGRRRRRASFFAAVKLDDYGPGRVLAHEKTLAKPIADRLALLKACRANFSPVFGLFEDPRDQVMATLRAVTTQRAADAVLQDWAGTRHSLWAVADEQTLRRIGELLQPATIYLADGHHRYETALRYHRGEGAADAHSDRVLMALASFSDPGLVMLPTHRVVWGLPAERVSDLADRLCADFRVEAWRRPLTSLSRGAAWVPEFMADLQARPRQDARVLGMFDGQAAYLLTQSCSEEMAAAAPERSAAWRQLDVSVLHTLLLQRHLGIDEAAAREQKNLKYTRDAAEAVTWVQQGQGQLAFFLSPAPVTVVKDVAAAGETMPQKSTYFYPKLLTGMVMHRLDLPPYGPGA